MVVNVSVRHEIGGCGKLLLSNNEDGTLAVKYDKYYPRYDAQKFR